MKTIVVGAGGGGITSAILASLRGEKVTLIEAHSHLGGCASYFKRGPYIFDVGATTISGIGRGGPLWQLFSRINASPSLELADPGIVFHLSSGKVIRYYHDFEKWMAELGEHFPHLTHRPFWERVRSVNESGWKVIGKMGNFPPRSLMDYLRLLKIVPELKTLLSLCISTDLMLKYYGLDDQAYTELINGILIISTQTLAPQTPFLMGAMGLSYPGETFALKGGMKGLLNFFETQMSKHGIEIRKNSEVTSFDESEIKLKDGQKLFFDRLILNLPVWNLSELNHESRLKVKFEREAVSHPGHWGAFTLYFGVKSSIRELYHQVHLNHPLVKNYFISFSIVDDEQRAPKGHQAVTISTHEDAQLWESLSEEDYAKRKAELSAVIMRDFQNRFKAFDISFLTSGTPKTFIDFTRRKSGFVGGWPLVFGQNPWSYLSPVISEKLYRTGDTVFPGQGWCGVVAGALLLDRDLQSRKKMRYHLLIDSKS